MGKAAILLVLALLAAPAALPLAEACSVPCGRIYPAILIAVAQEDSGVHPASLGAPVEIPATLTFRFDALNEGYTVALPNEPVEVGFEFPRKPGWVELEVEPARLEIPVNNPLYLKPTADPAAPQLWYEYTTDIVIRATVTGQAVLKDGYDHAKLLVFAKSTESGLYQAGYGIKEVKLAPEGALHESDLAGARDVFTASPLPALAIPEVSTSFGGLTATLVPPDQAAFWQTATLGVTLDPAPDARAALALHDERGDLVAFAAPADASSGWLALNATLAAPGLHTLSVTLLPNPGTTVPPVTLPLEFLAGGVEAEGWTFGKSYVHHTSGLVPAPTGNAEDALAQFERDVPFFAFDAAQSVSAVVSVTTPGLAEAERGLANLQVSLVDPDGNMLTTTSVDPYNPQKPLRLGSLPVDGWYALRLRGVGLPAASAWDARVEVAYATPPQARNLADGALDLTGGLARRVGLNVTLPLDEVHPWSASPFTPVAEGLGNVAYALTVLDDAGALRYASGLRRGDASFTPAESGAHRAFVYLEPAGGAPFPPEVRLLRFEVGDEMDVTAKTFPVKDAPSAPTSATDSVLAVYALPWLDPEADLAADVEGGRAELVDADGSRVEQPTMPGTYYLRVLAPNPGPEKTVPVTTTLGFANPVTIGGLQRLSPAGEAPGLTVPGLALGAALAALGTVAVAVALLRKN